MEMPKPNEHHQQLARLAGLWQGTETMYPSHWDPNGGTAQGTTRARVDLAGFVVITDYEQRRDGEVTFQGHGVYTVDPKANQVLLHWFDSVGQGIETFRGGWNGNTLTLQSESPMGHARLTYDYSKAGELKSAMDLSRDGTKWSRLFDGAYRRND